jgi:hypothetical protein
MGHSDGSSNARCTSTQKYTNLFFRRYVNFVTRAVLWFEGRYYLRESMRRIERRLSLFDKTHNYYFLTFFSYKCYRLRVREQLHSREYARHHLPPHLCHSHKPSERGGKLYDPYSLEERFSRTTITKLRI